LQLGELDINTWHRENMAKMNINLGLENHCLLFDTSILGELKSKGIGCAIESATISLTTKLRTLITLSTTTNSCANNNLIQLSSTTVHSDDATIF
jgi:hypothetical protein